MLDVIASVSHIWDATAMQRRASLWTRKNNMRTTFLYPILMRNGFFFSSDDNGDAEQRYIRLVAAGTRQSTVVTIVK